ncbi:Golgin sub A member 7B [Thoreauomyces humboldtii]|nr:Golgin sub A member 7B [Thoreauomyces humboldtii]
MTTPASYAAPQRPMSPQEHPATSSHVANSRLIVRINRSYGIPDTPQFSTQFPPELAGRLQPDVLAGTVGRINEVLRKAGTVGIESSFRTVLSCLSCFLLDACVKGAGTKALDEISAVVRDENEKTYIPAGLEMVDPKRTGLLHLDIVVQ